ncbi:MAG TPA: vanadium-dependent haloperoxidase [Bacteroidia bacterium]|nr:vanadium-dependent haloperoxidase [Bacteroidia bacterium]HNT79947.1 vanadium-dependent haloperoxidase [Bacteroidia bacterium]
MKSNLFFVLITTLTISCSNPQGKLDQSDLNYANRQLLEVSMEDGFSPPVASRVLVYSHISNYITLQLFYPDSLIPIQNHLNDFKFTAPEIPKDANAELSALMAFGFTAKKLVFNEQYMDDLLTKLNSFALEKNFSKTCIEASRTLAKNISDQIIQWAAKDQYAQTRTMDRYTSVKEPGKWIETPPDYTPGLEPHWEKIRTMLIDSPGVYKGLNPPAFDKNKDSEFYKMVLEVYTKSKSLTKEENEIAIYWDDNPNTSEHKGHLTIMTHKISPPGHWTNIIAQISNTNKLSFINTTRVYTYACIAMFDGIIDCWHTKYSSNLVRPITYIQENIESDWECVIQTPPFPEYTSGHSVVSAAAAEIMTQLLGDQYSFLDSTEVLFGHEARSFNSFHEAAWEVSLSRFYGGIHYMISVEEGNKQGKFIATQALKKLNYVQ